MLFFSEIEMLEGHQRPEYDHAIIEADSHEEASEKARRAFQASPGVDAIYVYEVPPGHRAKIPADLIDKRMTESVAEQFGIDSGLLLSDAAQSILAKFPGPVTLQPSKLVWLLFPGGLVIAAIGALPVLLLDPKGGWDIALYLMVGSFIAFGVLVMAAPVIVTLKVRMTLDAAGFERRSGIVSERRHWKDVRFFHPVNLWVTPVVVYLDSTRHGIWAERTLADLFSFGFAPAELAVLINTWRRRALSRNQ